MARPYLIVRVRGRLCALPVAQVAETLRLPPMPAETTGIAHVPGWIGTTMLRGELVAVLDLGALLGFHAEDVSSTPGRAVAVRLAPDPQPAPAEIHTLFAVDEVIGVKPLEPEDLQHMALPGGGELPMGRFDSGFVRLLDASGLLDPASFAELFTGPPQDPAADPGAAA